MVEFSEGADAIYRRHGLHGGRQKYGGRYTTTLGLFDKYRRIIFVNIRGRQQT